MEKNAPHDRDWLIPAGLMTGLLTAVLWVVADRGDLAVAFEALPLWMMAAALVAGALHLGAFVAMARAGVASPTKFLLTAAWADRRRLAVIVGAMALAGANMVDFMVLKPLLNGLVPFRFDALFGALDRALFFGIDPWRLVSWMVSSPAAFFYHRGWFVMMILALLVVLSAAPSNAKSASLITYFALWTVAGPLTHLMLPAAGPLFVEALGLGARFAAIPAPPETQEVATFLWAHYAAGTAGPGSGISAMPSLHIATTVWMVMAIRAVRPRWTMAFAGLGVVIFLLSVALGWHYVCDGLVGGLLAFGIERGCRAVLDQRGRRRPVSPRAAPAA